jgi:hypothetical protein
MAGGDLRLNNRKLKVRALPKIFLILLKLTLLHLTWVTNYMLLKCQPKLQNHAPNTVYQVKKISRAAMKAAQEAAKAAKAPVKGKKNNIFFNIQKHQFKTGAFYAQFLPFFFEKAKSLYRIIIFRSSTTLFQLNPPVVHSIFMPNTGIKGCHFHQGYPKIYFNLFFSLLQSNRLIFAR